MPKFDSENAVFLGHLGLGDHIFQQAIVNKMCEKYKKVICFAKHHNFKSVEHLASANNERIEVVSVSGDDGALQYIEKLDDTYDQIRIGCYSDTWGGWPRSGKTFDEFFYQQAREAAGVQVEHEEQWNITIPEGDSDSSDKIFDTLHPKEPFIFLHDDPARGFSIDRRRIKTDLKIVRPIIKAPTIFDYVKLIKHASEIHCIDSSFAAMIDRMGSEFTCHRYVRPHHGVPCYKHAELLQGGSQFSRRGRGTVRLTEVKYGEKD